MTSRQLRISLASSGELALFIPAPATAGGGHTIEVPCTIEGLRLIRETLLRYSAGETPALGSAARPVQSDVQALIAAFRPGPKKFKAAPDLEVEIDFSLLSDLKL